MFLTKEKINSCFRRIIWCCIGMLKREDYGKHGKFENFWFGPFRIVGVLEKNTFLLKHLDDDQLTGGPVIGQFY